MSLGMRLGESREPMEAKLEDHDFSGFGHRFEYPVYTYSGGMQVRLRFTTITSLDSDVLVIDEGIGAADPSFNVRASNRLANFFSRAGTLILTSHSNELLNNHCSKIICLNSGSLERGDQDYRPTSTHAEASSKDSI